MTAHITVIDYGVGNLHSIARAVQKVGAVATLTSDPDEVANAGRLLLPGVGAFGHCADSLRAAGMEEPISEFVRTGRPFLSICVGMQLLFDRSSEFGMHRGLGLIAGQVARIPAQYAQSSRKVPHVGWGTLRTPSSREGWAGTPLEKLKCGIHSAYFNHSFSAWPEDPADSLAEVDYQGFNICAAVQRDNICGLQFHPEMSGPVGLRILSSFFAHNV
jgi:glutamine amidotransferase